MVANHGDDTSPTPQHPPCSPRSFAKAHLDRLRSKSEALDSEVHELSQDFDRRGDEPESLSALRAQAAILGAEVRNLEQICQKVGDDCEQEIWEAVQRALRKRYLAELVSLRTAASFSERGGTLPKIDRLALDKRTSGHCSHQNSDNASSTEMPPTSSDSDNVSSTDNASLTSTFGITSATNDGFGSDDSVSMENSYVIETSSPPMPMAVPPPKWAPTGDTPGYINNPLECSTAHCNQYDIEVPSPVCPDLRTPSKLSLPLEGRIQSCEHEQQEIQDASCLSLSIEDWFDPELRHVQSRTCPSKVSKEIALEYDQDHIVTAMEEDIQMAMQVLGFRRCKGGEEESDSVLSVFWPLW